MPDYSMDYAYKLGNKISNFSKLPESINTDFVAQTINEVDDIVAKVGAYYSFDQHQKELFKGHIEECSNIVFPNMFSNQNGASILLRLWSGCLWAAKSIALETRDGKNTSKERKEQFENNIIPRCKKDPIFKFGVMSAPKFKLLRNDPVSYRGIPASIMKELSYKND